MDGLVSRMSLLLDFYTKSVRIGRFETYLEKEGGRIVTLVDMSWWSSASICHCDCGESIVNTTLLVECLDCRSLTLHIHRMVHCIINSQLLVKCGGTIPLHHGETGLLLSIDFRDIMFFNGVHFEPGVVSDDLRSRVQLGSLNRPAYLTWYPSLVVLCFPPIVRFLQWADLLREVPGECWLENSICRVLQRMLLSGFQA